MSDKINIGNILEEHGIRFKNLYTNKPEFQAAIKEIVEAVVDKCADQNAKNPDDSHSQSILQVKQMINYE